MIILLMVLTVGQAAADTAGTNTDRQQVSAETLKAKIDAVTQNTQLDEGAKNKLLELYRQGLDNLSAIETNKAQADAFVHAIKSAPEAIRKLNLSLKRQNARQEAADQKTTDDKVDPRPLKDLEQELLQAKAKATELESEVANLTHQSTQFIERPAKISQRLAEIKENENSLAAISKAAPQPTDNSELVQAQSLMAQTQVAALQSESRMLNQELVSMPLRSELVNVQRDEASVRLDLARQQLQKLEANLNRKRQLDASQSVGEAQEVVAQMADNQPILQQAAALNASYSEQLLNISAALKTTAKQRDELTSELNRIEESYASTKQKIEMAGLSHALGLLLHDIQRNLPNDRQLSRQLSRNRQVTAETGLVQVQTEDEKKKIDDLDGTINELIGDLPAEMAKKLHPELRTLLASRGDILGKIIAANRSYLSQLSEIELLYANLLNTVDDFNNFLEERLLWMRSTPLIHLADLLRVPGEFQALFVPDQWIAVGKALVQQAILSPLFFLALLCSGGLLAARRFLINKMESAVNLAGNPASYHFGQQVIALLLTMIMALPCPLLLGVVGWQLHSLGEANDFSRSVGTALFFLSFRLYYLRIIIECLRPVGLATRIFFWPKDKVQFLRQETQWFIFTFIPIVFFTQIAFFINYRAGSSHTLGRLSILLILAVFMVFSVRLLHPRAVLWRDIHATAPKNCLIRLRPFLFVAALMLPLFLAGLVVSGYIFAVGGLLGCLINTVWLSFALVLGHQMFERWLIQSERQLALKKSWSRSSRDMVEGGVASSSHDPESATMAQPEENLANLSQESRKLLNSLMTIVGLVGLWLVWFELLPALRMLNQYSLWTNVVQVNGQTTTIPVSVADAGMTLVIGCLTVIGTRHLPSLLTIIFLKRLQMSAASRYTVVTLTRYGIGAAGILYIADGLGFSWAQIQWLVAALGVGIGFGLQEIVANFISGIIILFERPIRVGDVVTVDTTDGVVTRIRIRATTIRDFDGKELLVPNKEFISGRLLNWSLSDPMIRILLPVGVAYGSDLARAMQLMRQTAENHPLVLKDPKPWVTFDSFADSALLLNLRCFVGSVDNRVRVRSDLHLGIDDAFRTAGISIAFPQQDVHLDTTTPLAVHLVREDEAKMREGEEG
nr:mechanosensitive ion channel domain-containing protein [uncultured Desulfobulbus sp.]